MKVFPDILKYLTYGSMHFFIPAFQYSGSQISQSQNDFQTPDFLVRSTWSLRLTVWRFFFQTSWISWITSNSSTNHKDQSFRITVLENRI